MIFEIPEILRDICDFLNLKEILSISSLNHSIRNDLKKYIYYRYSSDLKILKSDEYLEKQQMSPLLNIFKDRINGEKILELLKILGKYPEFAISGSFATYLKKGIIPPKTSDIDIFILGGKDKKGTIHSQIIQNFLAIVGYLTVKFGKPDIEKIGNYNNVFSFAFPEFSYEIQFVFTTHETITQLFMSFDASHTRCGFYLNEFYYAPDAKLTIDTNITYFYFCNNKKRFFKALQLGFQIFGLSQENCDIIMKKKHKNATRFPLENIYKHEIKFISNWIKSYDCFTEKLDLLKYDSWKYDIQTNWIKTNTEASFEFVYIIKTNISGLTIKKNAKIYVPIKIKDISTITEDIQYLECDAKNIKLLKYALWELTKKAFGWYQLPSKILYLLERQKDFMTISRFNEIVIEKAEEIAENVRKIQYSNLEEKDFEPMKEKIVKHIQNGLFNDHVNLDEKSLIYALRNIKNMSLKLYFGFSYRDFLEYDEKKETAYIKLTHENQISMDKIGKNIEFYLTFIKPKSETYSFYMDGIGHWKYLQ